MWKSIKHNFNSISKASSIKANLLVLTAAEDQVIPVENSKKLYKEWGGKKNMITIENTDHNNIVHSEEYWDYIKKTLKNVCPD